MKRTYFSGVTVAMALFADASALAEAPESRELPAMIALIEFITRNSSLEYAGEDPPAVKVVSASELQQRFRSESGSSADEDHHSSVLVSALYDRYSNEIFLSDAVSTPGPGLLHELVHFLQALNYGDDMFTFHRACLEAEAFELQSIWQAENEVDLASKPEYGFVMTLYGVCNDSDFSWIDSTYNDAAARAGLRSNRGQGSDLSPD